MRETRIYRDAEALARAASRLVGEKIAKALKARRRALIVLSGGSTPRESYRLLADLISADRVPADRLLWLFTDERWVPVSHPDSNEGMARDSLLDGIGAPERTILSWMAGNGDPARKAALYARRIRSLFSGRQERPDAVILGLGVDGHTASLFPGAKLLLPRGRDRPISADIPADAAAVLPEPGRDWRLTLCPRFLNTAQCAVFLVSGEAKRESLKRVLAGDSSMPGSWIAAPETLFLATRDAIGSGPADNARDARFACLRDARFACLRDARLVRASDDSKGRA
jgi:6-phosphogluconolactonase